LVGRKTLRDGGATAMAIATQIAGTEARLSERSSVDARACLKRLKAAREAFEQVVDFVVAQTKSNPNAVFAGSVPYLMLAGNMVAGWQLSRALMVAEDRAAAGEDAGYMAAKITTSRFYAEHILTRVPGLRDSIVEGADSVTAMALEAF
nr:acyl-CoA dehydrogenase C-terminal domain-containing protein [Methylibium sp.]